MTSLSGIVDWIRGHGCERLVKYVGNEIEISGLSLGAGTLKADVGTLSNKIKELERANELAKALDDCQYLLCTSLSKMKSSDELKDNVNRCRIMTIMAITQLRTLLAALDQQDEMDLKRELGEWIRYTNGLFRQATEVLLFVKGTTISHLKTRRWRRAYYVVGRRRKRTVKKRGVVPKKRAKPRETVRFGLPGLAGKYDFPLLASMRLISIDAILKYQGIDQKDLKTAVALLR